MEKRCEVHPKHRREFLCFNIGCARKGLNCILCLKKQHNRCKEEFITTADSIQNVKAKLDREEIEELLNKNLPVEDTETENMISAGFNDLKERTMTDLNFSSYENEDIIFLNEIAKLKKNYTISIEDSGDIVFNPKIKNKKFDTKSKVRAYKTKLVSFVHNFIDQINEVRVDCCYEEIFPSLFKFNDGVKMEVKDNKTVFTSKNPKTNQNDTIIYQKPLSNSVFKMRLISTGEKEPEKFSIEVGVITSGEYQRIMKDVSFINKKINTSYCVKPGTYNNLTVIKSDSSKNNKYLRLNEFFFAKSICSIDSGPIISFFDFDRFLLKKNFTNRENNYLYIRFGEGEIGVEIYNEVD